MPLALDGQLSGSLRRFPIPIPFRSESRRSLRSRTVVLRKGSPGCIGRLDLTGAPLGELANLAQRLRQRRNLIGKENLRHAAVVIFNRRSESALQ